MKNNTVLMAFLLVLAGCLLFEIIFHPLYAHADETREGLTCITFAPECVPLPVPPPQIPPPLTVAQYNALYGYDTPAPVIATTTATTTPEKPTIADLIAEIQKLEVLLKEVTETN